MIRGLLLLALAITISLPRFATAQGDDGPPISITSPDTGTTFAFATIKNHTLFWSQSAKVLVARVTFIEEDEGPGQPTDDIHEFRLPGVTFDAGKGIFVATTAKGESIPVAHYKKVLFIKSIETTPNAVVRVEHPRGVITVVLEAISPDDPAMHPHPADSDPDATHSVDINKILN